MVGVTVTPSDRPCHRRSSGVLHSDFPSFGKSAISWVLSLTPKTLQDRRSGSFPQGNVLSISIELRCPLLTIVPCLSDRPWGVAWVAIAIVLLCPRWGVAIGDRPALSPVVLHSDRLWGGV